MTISNERFKTLFLNWWEITEKDMTLSDMEDICKDIGMTRAEFIELVSQSGEFIDKDGWTPEPEANEKITPASDYFRFIEMLEGANVNFIKILSENTIEIKDGYDAIDFIFDKETLKLKEVSF